MFGLGSVIYAAVSIAGAFTLGVWYGKRDPSASVMASLKQLADDAMAMAQKKSADDQRADPAPGS